MTSSFALRARRIARHRRRVRLRQEHDRPRHRRPGTAATPAASTSTARPLGRQRSAARRPEQLRKLQMVFQDPFISLNPAFTVARTLAEPLRQHRICAEREIRQRIAELMRQGRAARGSAGAPHHAAFRRPAPARRHRPRAGARARDPDRRRGHLGARRHHPGADPRPVRTAAPRPVADLDPDLARSRRGALSVRAGRRHAPRPAGRIRPDRSRCFDAPQEAYTRELIAAIPRLAAA